MTEKPISPKWHGLIDYALVGSLLTLPSLLGMNKNTKSIYAAEAMVLLPYVALTKQPVAIKGLIPMETHGKLIPLMSRNSRYKLSLNRSERLKKS